LPLSIQTRELRSYIQGNSKAAKYCLKEQIAGDAPVRGRAWHRFVLTLSAPADKKKPDLRSKYGPRLPAKEVSKIVSARTHLFSHYIFNSARFGRAISGQSWWTCKRRPATLIFGLHRACRYPESPLIHVANQARYPAHLRPFGEFAVQLRYATPAPKALSAQSVRTFSPDRNSDVRTASRHDITRRWSKPVVP